MSAFLLSLALICSSLTPQEQVKFGVSFAQQGKTKAAKPLLEKAIKSKKLQPQEQAKAEAALGFVYLQKDKLVKAIEHLVKAVVLDPTVERPVLLLGMAYLLNNEEEKAKTVYIKALQTQKESAEIAHDLGLLLFQKQEFKAALPWLKKSALKKKSDPNFLIDYAYALNQLGQSKEAKDIAIAAVAIAPDNANILYTLATTHIALNEETAAKRVYKAAIDSDPMHLPSLYHLALLQSKAKKHQKAANYFIRVLKIDPRHEKARLYLAKEWAQLGKLEKASKLLQKGIEKLPNSPLLSSYHQTLADLFRAQKNKKQAQIHYQKAFELNPKNKKINNQPKK